MSVMEKHLWSYGIEEGIKRERERLLQLLEQHKKETECDCSGCESWCNAFEFLIKEIKGEVNE